MTRCGLTDEELAVHVERFGRLADWLGASETVAATAAGIRDAIAELIARREEEREARS